VLLPPCSGRDFVVPAEGGREGVRGTVPDHGGELTPAPYIAANRGAAGPDEEPAGCEGLP